MSVSTTGIVVVSATVDDTIDVGATVGAGVVVVASVVVELSEGGAAHGVIGVDSISKSMLFPEATAVCLRSP